MDGGQRATTFAVTGAASGIGAATVARLRERGHRVLALVRREDAAQRLREAGCDALVVDLADDDAVRRVGHEIDGLCQSDGLGGLVNCAGISTLGPVETATREHWRVAFDVNTLGAVRIVQACLPALRRGRGRIVNVGSIGGRIATPLLGGYAASKAALDAITTALRYELAPAGVSVSLVEPGIVDTPMTTNGIALFDACRRELPADLAEYYGAQLDRGARVYRRAAAHPTPAVRVARAIEHALVARRPRPRYSVGADARIIGWLHWLLPTGAFEWLVRRM